MAVAFGSIGTKAEGHPTVNIPYPASVTAGDLLVTARCAWVSTGVTTDDESGWTPLGELRGGTGTATDDHATRIRGDYRIAVGGEAGSVAFDQGVDSGTSDGAIGVMVAYTKGAGTWDLAAQTGDDATHAADRAVTLSASHAVAVGDRLVAFVAVDRDPAITYTSPTFTGTATFGTVNARTSGLLGSTLGRDGNVEVFDVEVTGAGTCTGFTVGTSGILQCGPVNIIRLREVGGGSIPSEGSATGSWSFTGTASGKRSPIAAGWGGFEFTGSATGTRTPKGNASGTLSWTGSASGQRSPKASGSGSYAYAGAATGTAPGVDSATGSATGTWAYTGTTAGKRAPKGAGTGVFTFTSAATGSTPAEDQQAGIASGSWTFAGGASGKRSPTGTATGTLAYAETAAGATTRSGTAVGAWAYEGTATGAQDLIRTPLVTVGPPRGPQFSPAAPTTRYAAGTPRPSRYTRSSS